MVSRVGHPVKRAQIRCVRCKEALTPWASFDGLEISVELPEGATDGPCIDPLDGSVENVHRYVFAVAEQDGVDITSVLESEYDDGEDGG